MKLGEYFIAFPGPGKWRGGFEPGFQNWAGGAIRLKMPGSLLRYCVMYPLICFWLRLIAHIYSEPHRGKRNWSGYIKYILEKISEVKKIDYTLAEEATSNNAIHLFKLQSTY